jgi:hypothetical protein
MFSKIASNKLPDYKPNVNYKIEINGNPEDLGYNTLYRISLEEVEAYRKYIIEAL